MTIASIGECYPLSLAAAELSLAIALPVAAIVAAANELGQGAFLFGQDRRLRRKGVGSITNEAEYIRWCSAEKRNGGLESVSLNDNLAKPPKPILTPVW